MENDLVIYSEQDLKELRDFIDYLLYERKYSNLTAKAYYEDVNIFFNFLKQSKIQYYEVTVPLVRTFMLDLTMKNYKKTSIRRITSGLTQFYNFLVTHNYADKNPFELILKPKITCKLPDFLKDNEIDELLKTNAKRNDFYAIRDQAIIELFYSSGLRVSELCNLTLQNIDLKQRFVRVFGKGKKERIVPFTISCQKVLNDYLNTTRYEIITKTNSSNNYLFLNKNGNKLTPRGIEYILNNIEKKTGEFYKLHPHKLRHTFATTLLNEGADLRTIQELMGHSSIGTTQIYTHVSYAYMKKTYDNSFPRAKMKPEDKEKDK